MRVFMTGATGYLGGAIAAALCDRGHEVAALVRPESEARNLRDRGVVIVSGELASLPELSETVAGYEVIVHAAQARARDSVALDKNAIGVYSSTRAFVVYTSGVWVFGNTGDRTVTESSPTNSLLLVAWRPAHEQYVLATGRSAVIRPGCVYGGRQSLLAEWFASAEQKRSLQVVGDGENRWAMVDLHELTDCYVRVAEQRATGIFHAVDDGNATINECARAVAPAAALDHIPLKSAREKLGPFADALVVNQHVSSEATRKALGWAPRRTFVNSVEGQWREWRSALQKVG
jgi:nucleoside-diphosphate-sugar epimerase